MSADWLYHCRTCGNTIERDDSYVQREGSKGPVRLEATVRCGCGAGAMHCDTRSEVYVAACRRARK